MWLPMTPELFLSITCPTCKVASGKRCLLLSEWYALSDGNEDKEGEVSQDETHVCSGLNGCEFSGGPTRQGLCSGHDLVAIKLHAYTQQTVRRSDRFHMDHVTDTNPISCRHVADFLWHPEVELHCGASA